MVKLKWKRKKVKKTARGGSGERQRDEAARLGSDSDPTKPIFGFRRNRNRNPKVSVETETETETETLYNRGIIKTEIMSV